MIELAIVGSRTFTDKTFFYQKINEFIEKYNTPDIIISGGAIGADTLGEQYANDNNILTKIFYPNWNKYGEYAYTMRNTEIVNNCTHILAFPSNYRHGTQDTIRKGKLANKEIMIFYID